MAESSWVWDSIIFSLQSRGGISTYWGALLRGLHQEGVPLRVIEGAGAERNRVRGELTDLPWERVEENPLLLAAWRAPAVSLPSGSLVHGSYYRPAPRGCRLVLTVYDLIYERTRKGPALWRHRLLKKRGMSGALALICISRATRDDLLTFYPWLKGRRLEVIPLAASEGFGVLPGATGPEERRICLYVGRRADGYKNFAGVPDAVAASPGLSLHLVGGGEPAGRERAWLDGVLPRRWSWSSPGEEALDGLYNQAFRLLYPSPSEGFGVPVLEAMRAGCPVLTSRGGSLAEVGGEAVELLETLDAAGMRQGLLRLQDASLWSERRMAGLEQAQRFSWKRCCQEHLELYRDLSAGG